MTFALHQLVPLFLRQLVRMNSAIRQLVYVTFAVHHHTHDFSDPSARTHRSCDLSRVMFSTAFTVSALTKYTPLFLISGSCPSPNIRISLLIVSQLRVYTGNLHSRSASSRSPHGNHTVSSDRKFSTRSVPFRYSWSGFPLAPLRQVAPSDCSSLEFPVHLGHTLAGAPLSITTSPSSRSAQPSWLKFTSLISFSTVDTNSFPDSALTFSTSTSFTFLS